MDISSFNHVNDLSKWSMLFEDDKNIVAIHTEPCDEYMHSNGMLLAAANAIDLNNPDDIRNAGVIIYDSYLLKLDKDIQDFFINHEIGHIMNGDMKVASAKKSEMLLFLRRHGLIPIMEFKADAFAAAIVGKNVAKKSFMHLLRLKSLSFVCKRDIFIRLLFMLALPIKNV